MDNTKPMEDDARYVPASWTVNPSGTWSQAPYEATLDTTNMSLGKHTLKVTFILQRYWEGAWHDVGDGTDKEKTVTFTLKEPASQPSSKPGSDSSAPNGNNSSENPSTGDARMPLWIPAATLAAAAGALLLLLRRRKRLG